MPVHAGSDYRACVVGEGGAMIESRRHDLSRGLPLDWLREVLKTGTSEMEFPAI